MSPHVVFEELMELAVFTDGVVSEVSLSIGQIAFIIVGTAEPYIALIIEPNLSVILQYNPLSHVKFPIMND